MDSHKSLKVSLEFVREIEQLTVESLVRQGSSFHSDEKLLGNLMEFLLSEQSAEEQALLERFYYQLLRCYRTSDEHLIKFVNQFIFCLIWRHFHDTIKSRQYGITIRPGLDALLVVIYNLMIVDNEGQYKTENYVIPSLSNPSLYHDPAEFTVNILKGTAGGRGRGETDEERRIVAESSPPVESLTRTKKWTVFRVLLKNIAPDVVYYSRACHKSAIIMGRLMFPASSASAARADLELTTRKEPKPFDKLNFKSFAVGVVGREKNRNSHVVAQPRTVLDERFLMDMLDILYILAYRGLYEESLGLVTDILDEGEYRLLAGVVLLASSIKNRLETGKHDMDELDEIAPVVASATDEEKEKPSRKISQGSMREKRRKSFMSRKEPAIGSRDRGGDSFTEIAETEPSWRSDTPNDSMLEMGDGYRSADASPQQTKGSARSQQATSPHSSETVV